MRRLLAASLCWLGLCVAGYAEEPSPLSRIAFGSCASQEKPQPIWDAVLAKKPELFLFLGDNIYGDSDNIDVLEAKYLQFAGIAGFQKLRKACPVMATWDDHDYGINDGGADYPIKDQSQKLFVKFWQDPPESPRHTRPGVYESKIFGPVGKRVQVILLDTRYFRSPLKRDPAAPGRGKYVPDEDASLTMLGAEQWKWLEGELRKPAEVRLIGSSIQLVAEDHPFEKWGNFPRERAKFLQLLHDTKAEGVIVLSGDRHLAELSQMDAQLGYPLFDLTSSGLNMGSPRWRAAEMNRHRVATMTHGNNFGAVQIDWTAADPLIRLQIFDEAGELTIQQKLLLSSLKIGDAIASRTPQTGKPPAASPTAPAPAGEVLTTEQAAKRVNEKVTVELTVQHVGGTKDKSRIFLNSHADYRVKENFCVVLDARKLGERLKEKNILDPGAHYLHKKVRVTGKVTEFKDAPQIQVESLDQIAVVE